MVQQDLDIQEYTDRANSPVIPTDAGPRAGPQRLKDLCRLLVLGAPSIAGLWADLRELTRRLRRDWDIPDSEVRAAWERGERTRFFPYGKSFSRGFDEWAEW